MPNIFEIITEGLARAPKAVADAWLGNSSSVEGTTAQQAYDAVSEIRAVTIGGYTLYVFTASDAAWAVPPTLANSIEAWAGTIGGGGMGEVGFTEEAAEFVIAPGGLGGKDGGIIVKPFDTTLLGATLAISIGVAAASAGADGGVTTIVNGATILSASVPGIGGIYTAQGYLDTTSKPGRGGNGGTATVPQTAATTAATAGVDGEPSAEAAGGTGGTRSVGSGNGTAGTGTSGAAGQTAVIPITGGGGGGGGGGASRYNGSAVGGNGGNGAFPGGGSGGGGAAACNGTIYSQTGGTPGSAAHGIAWILCR